MSFDGLVRVLKADDLTNPTAAALYTPGVKTLKGGAEYLYVYNAGNSVIATGKYCVADQNAGTSFTSGFSVTVTNASLAGWMIGVAQTTIATGYYGFVMTKGVSLVALDGGAVSFNAGVDLALGTDGGFVAAGATFSTAPRFGFALNSGVTTVGTSKARIFGSVL